MENKDIKKVIKTDIESIIKSIEDVAKYHDEYVKQIAVVEKEYAGERLASERNVIVEKHKSNLKTSCDAIVSCLGQIENNYEQIDNIEIGDAALSNAINVLSNSKKKLSVEAVDNLLKNFAGKNKDIEVLMSIAGEEYEAYEPIFKSYMYECQREFSRLRVQLNNTYLHYGSPYEITNVRTEMRRLAKALGIDILDVESESYMNFRMRNMTSRMGITLD